MPNHPIAEVVRQLVEGDDFSSPSGLLRSIKAEMAVTIPPGAPYSIATNVRHAAIWNNAWLARLRGESVASIRPGTDFPVVTAAEWPDVRKDFIVGLNAALEIARTDPFTHGMRSDEDAIQRLGKIVNHSAYHIGQIQLLKRMLAGKE